MHMYIYHERYHNRFKQFYGISINQQFQFSFHLSKMMFGIGSWLKSHMCLESISVFPFPRYEGVALVGKSLT